ncbi:dephospho-CoA kinase [Patiriisocius hiemis]|uniref:Dephospho-CoA kinase n=1 Tax=Patiriisocius hiemis TaxID=3075604 RepID=A0ABU2YAD7_9FLAO|nr:dephospho-CoA kinase [Constantimarinum sp. W242]MDT0555153.1 dephospho-CoA kinase [Constantimarinum sp. W242]
MKIVGLTGGIGSGKTTVSKMFSTLGVPVYIADIEAKKLTNTSKVIRKKITTVFGEDSYINDVLDSKYIANIVFNDSEKLEKLNNIIHPKVAKHFKKWCLKQESVYCIKEAAILFENGGYKSCDATILVTAPEHIRIERVMQRDGVTKEEVKARMKNQWSDTKKRSLTRLVIENIDLEKTQENVLKMHEKFLETL